MGLGPPVCLKCRMIMQMVDAHPWWVCRKCGKCERENESNLWCLAAEDQEEFRKNTEEFWRENGD